MAAGAMMRLVLALIAILTATLSMARAEAEFHDVGGGWHEAWIGVSDIDCMEDFFRDVAGWERVKKGAIDRNTLAYIAPGAAKGRFVVMRSPDYPQGWARLIEIGSAERPIIRSNAQAWDTGGIFSLMTRSADAARNLRDAERLGWTAYNDPYDFGFGDLKLRNIVLRGPDGVNVAIYEWLAPKRTDARPAGALSKSFNAMQMVADLDSSLKFYIDGLGFRVIQRGEFLDTEERPTNFALPVNLSTTISRRYAILIPHGGNDEAGRIELMEFQGLRGRDLSSRAALHARGIVSLLFPVEGIEAMRQQVAAAGAQVVRETAPITLAPYGRARAFTIASPDGAMLTFFQPAPE